MRVIMSEMWYGLNSRTFCAALVGSGSVVMLARMIIMNVYG